MEVRVFNKVNITTILAVLAGFTFFAYEYILRITPSVMEMPLSTSMHVSVTMVGALSAYYYYSYIPMQILVGIMLDKYELKRTLTIASLLCAVGTALTLVSHSGLAFSIGRFIQGFGSAFAWVGIMKIAAVYLPKRFYGLATSFGAVFGFIGAAFGQAILGFLVHFYGKNITLTILTFIGFFISYFIFNELSRAQQQKLSLEYTMDTSVTFKKWWQHLKIVLRTPYVWAGGVIAALLFTPTTVFAELWGVNYLAKVYSYTDVESSFISSMIFIGWSIGAAISGALTVFTANRMKLIRYGALGAFVLSLLILYLRVHYETLCFLCILFGVFSSTQVLGFVMGRDVLPGKLAGVTGATINLVCMGIGVAFQRLTGVLLDLFWMGEYSKSGLRIYSVNTYKVAMVIIPAVLLACYIFTYLIDEKSKSFKPFKEIRFFSGFKQIKNWKFPKLRFSR